MAINPSLSNMQKVTVTLPKNLIERLGQIVPARQRSRFITVAIQEQLAILEQVAALEETAGIWTDENHPEMLTESDMDHWLDDLRGQWGTINE